MATTSAVVNDKSVVLSVSDREIILHALGMYASSVKRAIASEKDAVVIDARKATLDKVDFVSLKVRSVS